MKDLPKIVAFVSVSALIGAAFGALLGLAFGWMFSLAIPAFEFTAVSGAAFGGSFFSSIGLLGMGTISSRRIGALLALALGVLGAACGALVVIVLEPRGWTSFLVTLDAAVLGLLALGFTTVVVGFAKPEPGG